MRNAQQAALPLSFEPSFTVEDFVVSACNEEAYRRVTAWPGWPSFCLNVHGGRGSGKTHLARIWKEKTQALELEAGNLPALLSQPWTEGQRAYLLELGDNVRDEKALLHLYNRCKENGDWLLLTSAKPLPQINVALPDLSSRLNALPSVGLGEPDDLALEAVLRKLFTDRQLKVSEEVARFLLARMERSFDAAHRLVERLDSLSLEHQRRISIPLVNQALGAVW